MKNLLKIGALAVALVGMSNVAAAQTNKTADVNATATVLTDISVTGHDFTFGNVYRNTPATVLATALTAGYFDIVGPASSSVTISFTEDSDLLSGANTLPITWSYSSVSGTGACTGSFTSGALGLSASGAAKVCVGATVTPVAGTQPLGAYTGKTTITVAYP